MAEAIDILDERDPLGAPFLGSLLVHGAVVAIFFASWYWLSSHQENFGDAHPAGGPAYSVSPVHNIPIPKNDAPPNPVASDTKSNVPAAPAKQDVEKRRPVPDKTAIEIPDKLKREAPRPQRQEQYTQPAPNNQVYSRSRAAVSNPMYGGPTGSGQVGIGPDSQLGFRLGWYAELVRQRIAQNWQTNGLDSRSQGQPAVVKFVIMRDGHVRTPQIIQSSGNPNIDDTALRAVYAADPMPPLPQQVSENSISAQFTFNLR